MNESKLFYIELKEQREAAGISLEDISESTKIDIKYLMAIEEGDFSCLPNVYMRLFLRSYCQYIKVDAVKALNDYEFHTIGTVSSEIISPTNKIEDNKAEIDSTINEETLNIPPVSKSQMITISATIIILILTFYLISSITSSNSTKQDEIIENDISTSTGEVDNQPYFSPIPNQDLLTNKEFDSNLISSESAFLSTEFPPYIFTIKALTQTKINIDNDGKIISKIIASGEHESFQVDSVINFDLWSASHVSCQLNDIDLESFFGKGDQSIRGSFESQYQKLYYQVHKQIQY